MPKLSRKLLTRQMHKVFGERRARAIAGWCYRTKYWFRTPPYFKIKSLIAINDNSVFINGWVVDAAKTVDKLELVFKDNRSLDITDKLHWSDNKILLSKFGKLKSGLLPEFVGFMPCPEHLAARDIQSIRISVKKPKGISRKISKRKLKITDAGSDPLSAVKKILQQVPLQSPDKRDLFDCVYGVSVKEIWSLRDKSHLPNEIVQYNRHLSANEPEVSLVIPIYGRYDFIEYQLNQFVSDPDMQRHEIIYVVDDPRIALEVKQLASSLEKLHNLAFTVVYLGKNYGYAGANNQGVSVARASAVLLLNSDVMPVKPGWLTQLQESVGNDITNTLTGVRLLYEDNTIQHDGMTFFASPFVNELWTNIHPGKGLPSTLVSASEELVKREAVTGACVLLSRARYLELGGFDENYILGDYEDSDLCMKARQAGMTIQLNNQVVLYHLERQSQCMVTADRWKQELTYYNCWYHTQKWDKDINNLKVAGLDAPQGIVKEPQLQRVANG